MAEYTPSTNFVLSTYVDYGGDSDEFNRWLDKVKTQAVYDYISTKEIASVKITFTNQPIFDKLIQEKQAEAWDQGLSVGQDPYGFDTTNNPYKES
jgi:hypothetical protein